MVETWTLRYDGFDPAREGLRETLCALGNGYVASRGAAPEAHADGVHYPGTYAAGCYNRLSDAVGGEVVENESLVNLPNWLVLTFRASEGEWLGQAGADLLSEHRELDLRRGVLTRRLRFRDRAGRTTRLTQRRFVHMEHAHLCGLHTTVVAEDWSGTLGIRSALDGTVRNAGVARYRDLSGRHLIPLRTESAGGDAVLLEVETTRSHIRIAQAARTRVFRNDRQAEVTRDVVHDVGRVGNDITVEARAGEEIEVEKLVLIYTSRDRAVADPATEAVDWLGQLGNFHELLDRHVLAWAQLWQRFRVVLHGNDRTLRTVRLHLFHLLATVSPNSVDLDVGVPPRGLHGEAYRGHILWDELFVFPILNLRVPLLTRALLRYRYRRLAWARRAAREAGCTGAMYPWQSGSDGREENQRLHLNPISGRWTADTTRLQRHIGLAVAYNVWQYYQVTADREFLTHYGAEMILEIARFFAGIATYDTGRGRYVIRGVMGPDEFHTGYPDAPERGIDNNAYTNVMTTWVLRRALDLLGMLPDARRRELTETLELHPGELDRWAEVSRRMYVPFHDGVISQFEGYEKLAEFDWEAYRAAYGDIHRLDRILDAEGDTPNRYKASKQADVLMLFYLLSADELGDLLDRLGYPPAPDLIPRTIEYYLARTSHGSTLSAVVHAWVLARAHRAQALDYFVRALDSDIADIQGGTTAEGIHLAAMAGSVDLLQRCFAGVETRGDSLWLSPYWPAELGTLELELRYREHSLNLRILDDRVAVRAGTGTQAPVRLNCHGQTARLRPGDVVEFSCPGT